MAARRAVLQNLRVQVQALPRSSNSVNPTFASSFNAISRSFSEEVKGRNSYITQSKVINGKTSLQSVTPTWKAVHGVSIRGHRSGKVASFCSVPHNTETTMCGKDLQPAVDGEKIKNTTNSSMVDLNGRQKKSTVPLFPFSGADLLYLRDGAGLYNNLFAEEARLNYIEKVRKKCWNLMGKSEKTMELVEKCLARDGPEGLAKEIEKMVHLVLRSKSVPYGCNTYLNEVKKMRTLVSERTGTRTTVETVKLRTIYQGASMIAQDICAQLKNKMQFRLIFGNIIKEIPLEMKNGVEGIRVAISGRINGAEIARTECGKYGKTSRTTFSQHVDYARAEAITRSGLIGVKVWISYRKNRKAQPKP